MSKGPVISRETAEKQLTEFLEYYEIEDEDFESDSDIDFNGIKKKLFKAFQRGRLEFTEDHGRPTLKQYLQYPPDGEDNTLYWRGVTGAAKLSVKKDANSMLVLYEFAAVMTGTDKQLFVRLSDKDLSTAEVCASVFLLV